MGKSIWNTIKNRSRLIIQICWSCLSNGFFKGFSTGAIYQGEIKKVCVPGLNCYSCPGALGSCPIGSLQNSIAGKGKSFPFYVCGFLLLFGVILGRAVCGFLCPFGLIQELIYKIPFPHKRKGLPGDKYLKFFKYVILLLFVIILPVFALGEYGIGEPWFCKYICPAGTLEGGLPLILSNPSLKAVVGVLFANKLIILIAILLLCLVVYRPFCKYFCPLGAIYSLFNKIAFVRMKTDKGKCISCGKCESVCKMGVNPMLSPNSTECIRCGECMKNCPTHAIVRDSYSRPSQQ